MVLTYIGMGLLSCGAIIATWHIMNKQYRGERDTLDVMWGPAMSVYVSPECDVCGVWTPYKTCSDCCTWGEMYYVEAFHKSKRSDEEEAELVYIFGTKR